MIQSFGSRDTEMIWRGQQVPSLPLRVQEVGRRKFRMLNNSKSVDELRLPPSNRLERLCGDLSAYYSIRFNIQWRIIFKWDGQHATDVEILEYHLM